MPNAGSILYLNGPSSAGKSSLALAIQRAMPEPYLHVGIDVMFEALEGSGFNRPVFADTVPDDRFGGVKWRIDPSRRIQSVTFGEYGQQMVRGFHAMVAALASEGNHVIVDDVLFNRTVAQQAARRFAALPAYLIGVRCDEAELTRRETERDDRITGIALLTLSTHDVVSHYDYEVDTTHQSAEHLAKALVAWLATTPDAQAFRELVGQG